MTENTDPDETAAESSSPRVLEEDEGTHKVLRPLAVALRLEAGEKIRVPAEMLEVAAGIQAAIEERRRRHTR